MQEDFLHFIWKYKKFDVSNLWSTKGESISVVNLGQHNHNSGPDFFNAQININGQLWAGNVEIHVKSSDWYVHNHEKDKTYDNVILHVVWEHDSDIFRKDNSEITTLELKDIIDSMLLNSYNKLLQSKSWINCETDFSNTNEFLINNWLERLYVERLERKSKDIETLLFASNNDWEAVLFKMLVKNFGLKVNGESFLSLANSFNFPVIRKIRPELSDLEALFFGQAGLLDNDVQDVYFQDLYERYQFLKQKFQLNNQGIMPLQFFRLRPPNFPTLRLSQLAVLYHREPSLFSDIIKVNTKEEFYKLFKVEASEFWNTHYTFAKISKSTKKKLSKSFIDLLIINTILPLKFSYAKARGKAIEDSIFALVKSLDLESNSITEKFLSIKPLDKSGLTSQALIQLKTEYCNKNKCLQCAIGSYLISKNE
ncbi:DUF2851 family protein [Winogradskyella haliclonae]|uniref:DUF2851 family protein n=1 Tax=Winogradskyella haliclonae TaxID=2048558 RepID=A0ABQ2BX60_9FLAO|nr:DUF2851 family protein [Winogradskyella haliclonae]GGI57045.1 hypothetical protein GCM10011444_13540 [Winogradskyella haliclonae]